MKHRKSATSRLLAVGILVLGLAAVPLSGAHAFSVTPNDTVDFWPTRPGDPFGGGGTGLLTAGLGLNRASGALTCIGFGCSDPYDSFRIEVPVGLEITLTEFTSHRTSGFNTLYVLASDGVSIIDPLNDPVFPVSPLIALSGTSGAAVSSSLVVGAGFWDVVIQRGVGGAWLVDFSASPAAVPEPSTGILMMFGLSALLAGRR